MQTKFSKYVYSQYTSQNSFCLTIFLKNQFFYAISSRLDTYPKGVSQLWSMAYETGVNILHNA
jgi:hypothetical protein